MSGHSKWHNIQERKGKQDAKRGNLFTKFAKAVTIAAQKGGPDPTMNFSLRLAIDKSKAIGMPKDNIDRAIKRGTGELNDGIQMEEVMYEAFGPGGTAILVKVVTDNKNRTLSDIKHIMSQNGGNFGSAGSVQWMFEHKGVVTISNEQLAINKLTKDDFELQMIDIGADDILEAEEEKLELRTKIENFQKVIGRLKDLKIEPVESGVQWVAKDPLTVDKTTEEKLGKLFSDLEENDDVEDYYTNAI